MDTNMTFEMLLVRYIGGIAGFSFDDRNYKLTVKYRLLQAFMLECFF